ncbi:YqaJ viral recombinase family protein (plasmid) [Bordetella bronchiseptica]|uniref:YqaJ viral recombinase family protein n=1 Tax=Bordetella bronchiseptica TaxID=518 RepID=UPI002740768E|nr:YqaJ viral recombinase family protein [Bordetella bronchiseptica]WLS61546.1 YqaJ viral recombinase family protein [Bordetella bronchiseptica]
MKPLHPLPHEQGSDGWLLDRCGRVTGSRAADMLAMTAKKEWSTKRADYKFELAIEVLTGMPQGSDYTSKEMQWGIDQEPFARMAYEEASGNVAIESGFMYLPDVAAGCSR